MSRLCHAFIVVALVTVAISACGGDDDDDGSSSAAADCEQVDQAMLEQIASGAEATITPVEGAAYKSPDYEDVTFIAMQFSAEGIDDQVGVWATNNFDTGGGVMLAVDGFAQEFTDFPDADSSDADISAADPGVERAKDCLG